MTRPILESAVAGIAIESDRFDRSAARVTRLAGAPSAAQTADSVDISQEARDLASTPDTILGAGLEGAMVDLRVAKYAFVANLRVLSTGQQMEDELTQLVKNR